jgi:membrane fusion protein (multidrug efflux system)
MNRAPGCFAWVAATALAAALIPVGCTTKAQPGAPPPPEVTVIEARRAQATAFNEYVAQTQAPDTIEIRAQVTGLLERQLFADGARVKKGDLLYVIDRRPFEAQLAQAIAGLAQAEANVVNANQNLARQERLIAQNAVSVQEYDSAVAQSRAAGAVVEAQRALRRNAEINVEFTALHAPRDGYMSSSLVKPGSLVTAQQTLLDTLYSSDPMWVSFTVGEQRLLELQKAGKRPDATTPFRIILADGSDYPYPAHLQFVDAAIDARNGSLNVRVSVPNPDRLLRPGLFVRVAVPVLDSRDAIRVPQQAVQELQGTQQVLVVGADGKVQARQIHATQRLGSDWIVASGLEPGERVVVEGSGKVKVGAIARAVLLEPRGASTVPAASAAHAP